MTAPPTWGEDWAAVRDLWTLDPDVAYLNHGSFGATPAPVLAEQQRLRAELEREPVDFLHRSYAERIRRVREALCDFLGADAGGLALVPNATTGVAAVLASLSAAPGDDIVVSDHAYPAVLRQLQRYVTDRDLELVVVHLPLPRTADDDLCMPLLDACGERTRLLVVDAVTSPTALRMPVESLVRGARDRNVPCLVDAAHAPGMLPVDVRALDPDWWTGNLHKWGCAPKGSAVLWARTQRRASLRPLVLSHVFGEGFPESFDWAGTTDPTAWLATPSALDLLGDLGWQRIRDYGHALAGWGAAVVGDAIGIRPPYAGLPGAHASMTLVDPGPLTRHQAQHVHDVLWHEHRVDVPLLEWAGQYFLRLSAHVYNSPPDYWRLAEALPSVLAAARRGSGP